MRKVIVLLAIVGLAMMATSALAVGLGPNELENGDFSSGLDYWTKGSLHSTFTVYAGPVAGISSPVPGDEKQIFQVIDESLFPGWNASYNKKLYRFDADLNITNAGNTAEFYIFAYNSNPAIQPTFNDADAPGDPNWIKLIDGEIPFPSGGYFYGPVTTHVTSGPTLLDFQPRWVVIALEAQINNPVGGVATWANVDFEAMCVPVPPAVWLFGSGLLGLVGWRRFKA